MFKRISLLLLLLPLLTLSSCKDDEEIILMDIRAVDVEIIIQNAEGQNILSPGIQGSLYGSDISIEYNGETYNADWGPFGESRYYMPNFYGLKFMPGYSFVNGDIVADPSKDMLMFGEFAGDENQNISAVLKINGQPETYKIDIVHEFKWKNKEPKYNNKVYLNGELIKGRTIIIRLPE